MGTRTKLVAVLLGMVVMATLSSGVSAQVPRSEEEPTLTLYLEESPLEDALRLIIRPPYSFALEPGVTGTVTVSLHEVTFSQALRVVLDLNKLTYRKDGMVYVISRREESTAAAPAPAAEPPTSEKTSVYWIGTGGRYELQAIDSRYVSLWFGGTTLSLSPIPYAVDTPSGGMMGGAAGGIGGRGAGSAGIGGGIGGMSGGLGGIGGTPGGTGGNRGGLSGGPSGGPSGGTPSGGTPSGGTPSGGTPSGGTPSGGTPSGGTPSGGTPS